MKVEAIGNLHSNTTQHRTGLIPALGLFLLAGMNTLRSESPEALVRQGNEAFAQGNYEEAVKAYDQASVDNPESPHIYFNRGTVHYRKEEFEEASEAFKKAALRSRDSALEKKCKYNLGNCAFRECERQRDSDLKKALEQCEKAINYYREALDLDPDLENAGKNIEIARLTMKIILDEIDKRNEEARKKQKQQEETAKELQQLIKRQENAIRRNEDLSRQRTASGSGMPANVERGVRELSQDQEKLKDDTRDFSKNLEHSAGQAGQAAPRQPPGPEAMLKHLGEAVSSQGKAVGHLRQKDLPNAEKDQTEAMENLKKALEEMTQEKNRQDRGRENQPRDGPGQQQEQQKGAGQKQPKESEQQKAARDKDGESEEKRRREAMARQNAEEILDEEAKNRENRRAIRGSGNYRPVEKDW